MIYLSRLKCAWPSIQPVPKEWKQNDGWSEWTTCSERDYNNREMISSIMKQYIYEWKKIND